MLAVQTEKRVVKIGNSELILGDCFKVLESFEDKSIDVIFTSVPFYDKDLGFGEKGICSHVPPAWDLDTLPRAYMEFCPYYPWFAIWLEIAERKTREYVIVFNSAEREKYIHRLTDPTHTWHWIKAPCYDDETEVLTSNGWKFFHDVQVGDKICTLNPITNEIEYQYFINKIEREYEGEMYHIFDKSHSIDIRVTPSHKFFVKRWTWDWKRTEPRFVEAQHLNGMMMLPRSGVWKGKQLEHFVLPEVEISHPPILAEKIRAIHESDPSLGASKIASDLGCHSSYACRVISAQKHGTILLLKKELRNELKIPMPLWLKFFGFWLADGWVAGSDGGKSALLNGHYTVGLAVVEPETRIQIEELVRELSAFFQFHPVKNAFIARDKQLWSYLSKIGNANTKYIPDEIKELDSNSLRILFEWMVKGDGHMRHSVTGKKSCRYTSVSKRLANDVQEIALKMGLLGRIIPRKELRKAPSIMGREIKSNGTIYDAYVYESTPIWIKSKYIHVEEYKGTIHCLEVPNHVMYVRKNGAAIWCGNSSYRTKSSPIFVYKCKGSEININGSAWATIFWDRPLEDGFSILAEPVRESDHPYEDPLKVYDEIMYICKKMGCKTICDPFAGSGTSILAALKNNLKATGIEINPKYFELSVARVRSWSGQQLLGQEE